MSLYICMNGSAKHRRFVNRLEMIAVLTHDLTFVPSILQYRNMTKTNGTRQRKALVVGAGPVGALTALSLHRRGWEVEIWESREGMSTREGLVLTRPDPRGKDTAITNLRSINLAISARGLEALRSVDPTLGELFSRRPFII